MSSPWLVLIMFFGNKPVYANHQDNLNKDVKIINGKSISTSPDFSKLVIRTDAIRRIVHLNTIIMRLAVQALYE